MRLELTKRTDLALRALTHLSSTGNASGRELAEAIDTTTTYLPQVLKPLVMSGWVDGTPGPGGGYQLTVDVEGISILNVVEAMEGETDQNRCVLRGVPCPALDKCALHQSWVRARAALLAELDSTPVVTAATPAPTKENRYE